MCWALREMSGVMLRSWIRDQQRPFLIHKFHLMNTIQIQTNCSARNERLTLSVTLEENQYFSHATDYIHPKSPTFSVLAMAARCIVTAHTCISPLEMKYFCTALSKQMHQQQTQPCHGDMNPHTIPVKGTLKPLQWPPAMENNPGGSGFNSGDVIKGHLVHLMELTNMHVR